MKLIEGSETAKRKKTELGQCIRIKWAYCHGKYTSNSFKTIFL